MELLDIYDNNGNPTGKTIIRGDNRVKLNNNEHIAVAVIIIENNNKKFLIQKTSKQKGSKYSLTGGHIKSKDTPRETIIKEVSEELGIDISNDSIKDYGFICYDMPLRYIYYLKKDININNIKLQKEEVEYVKYMTKKEVKELIKDNKFLESHGIIFNKIIK